MFWFGCCALAISNIGAEYSRGFNPYTCGERRKICLYERNDSFIFYNDDRYLVIVKKHVGRELKKMGVLILAKRVLGCFALFTCTSQVASQIKIILITDDASPGSP